MNDELVTKIRTLFAENEAFRKDFITNTKAAFQKYGVDLGDIPIDFRDSDCADDVASLKCVIVKDESPQLQSMSKSSVDYFFVCRG